MGDWEGEERRSIQAHVLNWVEERLGTHVKKMEEVLAMHEDDEKSRYKEILDLIERNNEENRKRHNELCRSFDTYTDHTEKIYDSFKLAFLTNVKGEPDFHGHARAHESWVEERKDQKEFMAYVKKVVGGALATALVMWMGVLMWQGVLAGPK